MADEKKPVDGTEDTANQDEATFPKTDDGPETVADAVVTDDVDMPEPDAGSDTVSTGPDTASDGDAVISSDSDDTVPLGDETIGPDEREAGDTLSGTGGPWGADRPGDTASSDSADAIHSMGEAEELAAASSAEGAGKTDTPDSDTTDTDRPEPVAHDHVLVPAPEPVVERKGGFVPMVLGGVVAAALGFGASSYVNGGWPFGAPADDSFEADTTAALEDQASRIDALSGQVDDISGQVSGIDLSAVDASISDLGGRLDAAQGESQSLSERLSAIDDRMTALEKRPVAETVSPEAIAAYERELEEVRQAIETQRTEVEQMTQQALAAEATAAESATLSASRAALADLNAALQNGEPYAAQLGVLESNGVTVPEALGAPANDGIATLSQLTADFPPLAREGLAEARRSAAQDGDAGGRFSTFIANQLGARSVTPREGDGADAVLSRAEAALNSGDLSQTLQELSLLSDAAKAPLSDWLARAQTRVDAVAASDSVAQQLNKE